MKEGRDVRNWRENEYRSSILEERQKRSRIVFRAVFAPPYSTNPDMLVAASSDGLVASYSLASCIRAAQKYPQKPQNKRSVLDFPAAEPLSSFQGHKGPAYDVKFYGEGGNLLLLSCGDDGRIRGWKWTDFLGSEGTKTGAILDLLNPQESGPWGALSPIPESNAIAVDSQGGSVFSAAGDSCAYCWDVEKSVCKTVFRGHRNYLHCIATCPSRSQIITGSEDGTARIWDCRTGECVYIVNPESNRKKSFSWISCIAVDESENWLACGSTQSLSIWSLPTCECILNFDASSPFQDLLFDHNQVLVVGAEPWLTRMNMDGSVVSRIQCATESAFSLSLHGTGVTAVGGYGGLVDVISVIGSHLCTFSCM